MVLVTHREYAVRLQIVTPDWADLQDLEAEMFGKFRRVVHNGAMARRHRAEVRPYSTLKYGPPYTDTDFDIEIRSIGPYIGR